MPGLSHGQRVWKTKTRASGGHSGGRAEPTGTGTGGREDGSAFDWAPRETGSDGVAAEGGVVVQREDRVSDPPSKPGLKDRVLTKVGERIGNKIEDAMDTPATEFINGQPVLISIATKKGAVSAFKVLLGVLSGLGVVSVSIDTDTLNHVMDQINIAWASLSLVIVFGVGVWRVVMNLWKKRDAIRENGLQIRKNGGSIVFYRKPKGRKDWEAFDLEQVTST